MMALRIYVNRELEELDALLEALPELVRAGGRAAVLTYHSLEARRVKRTWRRQQRQGLWELLTPSPAKPSAQEVERNPRVRSAQLRAARRQGRSRT
jgi:16S rRNA (cytosine1402-N4)-methyltransferase